MTEQERAKLTTLHQNVLGLRNQMAEAARVRNAYVAELAKRYRDAEIAQELGLKRQRIGAMREARA